MILSDKAIKKAITEGFIVIKPFSEKQLGSNSYDVKLSKYFAFYRDQTLDCKKDNELVHFEISEDGYWLEPGTLYLSTTQEYTETYGLVPMLEGCSSTGRLGISIHITAGVGDVAFCNHWTLEITAEKRVKVYPGMVIGQIVYHTLQGEVENPYNTKSTAKYNEVDPRPQSSKLFKKFEECK